MKINEIATWFYDNNEKVRNDKTEVLVNMLCLFAKTAFLYQRMEDLSPLKIQIFDSKNVKIDMGIKEGTNEHTLNSEEINLLNSVNRYFGYTPILNLLNIICETDFFRINESKAKENEVIIDNDLILESFTETITDMLKTYKDYDFSKEDILVIGDNTFFVEKDAKLTNKEIESLKTYQRDDQNQFDVFRNPNGEGLVIY